MKFLDTLLTLDLKLTGKKQPAYKWGATVGAIIGILISLLFWGCVAIFKDGMICGDFVLPGIIFISLFDINTFGMGMSELESGIILIALNIISLTVICSLIASIPGLLKIITRKN